MGRAEKKIIAFCERNSNWIFGLMVTFLAVMIRYYGRGFESEDMKVYLLDWFGTIQSNGGVHALGEQVGNYNLLYQTLIAFMTYLDWNPKFCIKGLSICFDFLLAIAVAVCIRNSCPGSGEKRMLSLIGYGTVLLLPTVWLNSAYWGQCEAIYTFFLIMMLYCIQKRQNVLAFVLFGAALAFKLQAIFLLPFLLIYYIVSKKYSIFYLGISVLTFWLSGIVCYCNGREPWAAFSAYFEQTDTYSALFKNFPGFWVCFGNSYEAWKVLATPAILLTIGLQGIALLLMLHWKSDLTKPLAFYGGAAWSVWTCVIFLPEMHERYAYAVEILLVITGCLYVRYLIAAIPAYYAILCSYACYLFAVDYDLGMMSKLYFAAYCVYTYLFFRNLYLVGKNGTIQGEIRTDAESEEMLSEN